MSEVKEKELKGMSMNVPKQTLFVLKRVAAFKGMSLQDSTGEMSYRAAMEYLKENGLLEVVQKLYREQELEDWDNEL
jgi:predicted nucleotidyltransferase